MKKAPDTLDIFDLSMPDFGVPSDEEYLDEGLKFGAKEESLVAKSKDFLVGFECEWYYTDETGKRMTWSDLTDTEYWRDAQENAKENVTTVGVDAPVIQTMREVALDFMTIVDAWYTKTGLHKVGRGGKEYGTTEDMMGHIELVVLYQKGWDEITPEGREKVYRFMAAASAHYNLLSRIMVLKNRVRNGSAITNKFSWLPMENSKLNATCNIFSKSILFSYPESLNELKDILSGNNVIVDAPMTPETEAAAKTFFERLPLHNLALIKKFTFQFDVTGQYFDTIAEYQSDGFADELKDPAMFEEVANEAIHDALNYDSDFYPVFTDTDLVERTQELAQEYAESDGYIITDDDEYHSSVDDARENWLETFWKDNVTFTDESDQVEMISEPLPMGEALELLEEMLAFINQTGHTTDDSGLHVNMSFKRGTGKDMKVEKLNVMKLVTLLDNTFILKRWPPRQFVDNIFDEFDTDLTRNAELGLELLLMHDYDSIISLIETHRPIIDRRKKWQGINFGHFDDYNDSDRRIEFRYTGGEGYEQNFEVIKKEVTRFGYMMLAAYDDDFGRKEYKTKILRTISGHFEKNTGVDFWEAFKLAKEIWGYGYTGDTYASSGNTKELSEEFATWLTEKTLLPSTVDHEAIMKDHNGMGVWEYWHSYFTDGVTVAGRILNVLVSYLKTPAAARRKGNINLIQW